MWQGEKNLIQFQCLNIQLDVYNIVLIRCFKHLLDSFIVIVAKAAAVVGNVTGGEEFDTISVFKHSIRCLTDCSYYCFKHSSECLADCFKHSSKRSSVYQLLT